VLDFFVKIFPKKGFKLPIEKKHFPKKWHRNEKNCPQRKRKNTNCKEFENHPSNKNSAWQSFNDAKASSSTPNKLGVPQV
jgi:hypothetical protein